MKKELIYKLINKGYEGEKNFSAYITSFIQELRNENYHQMANDISEIQSKNTKVIRSEFKTKKEVFIFPKDIISEKEIIKTGYQKNIIKNIMLEGRPGTGKTSFVKQISKEIKIPFYEISLSNILDYKYGESIKKLEELMNNFSSEKCIIFFDEADALFKKRGSNNDVFESDRILTTMLKILDKENKAIIFFATNLYKDIDSAIKRRMDLVVNFDIYEYSSLVEIFDIFLKNYNVDIDSKDKKYIHIIIKNNLEKFTPSDLKTLSKRLAITSLMNKINKKVITNYMIAYKDIHNLDLDKIKKEIYESN